MQQKDAPQAPFLPEQSSGQPARASAPKQTAFPAFCQQVDQVLLGQRSLDSLELSLLQDYCSQNGPFAPDRPQRVGAVGGHAGRNLHIVEYLKALVAAHLNSAQE